MRMTRFCLRALFGAGGMLLASCTGSIAMPDDGDGRDDVPAGSTGTSAGGATAGGAAGARSGTGGSAGTSADPGSLVDDDRGEPTDDAVTRDAGTASDARTNTETDAATAPPPGSLLYVAVGWGGRRTSSVDGRAWQHEQAEAHPGGDDNNLLRGVGYGNGLFVAVGGGPNIRMLVTRDGRTWTKPSYPGGQWLGGVAYGNGVWVAVGGLGRRMVSSDGMTWRDAGGTGSHLRAVAFANGRFVAAGSGMCTSTVDGQTWTRATSCGSGAERVAGGGGRWVVVPYSGRAVATSGDGQTWTVGTLPRDSRNGITFAAGRFLVATSGGVLTSSDGGAWEFQATTSLGTLAWDGFTKILGAQDGTLKISSDGIAWMNGTPSGNSITGIAAGPVMP